MSNHVLPTVAKTNVEAPLEIPLEILAEHDATKDFEPVSEAKIGGVPYSLFTPVQRTTIVIIVSITGLLSPLSSNLYVPAIPSVAKDIRVTVSQVNLTVTSYLIFQGITPMIWSSIGDSLGRRQLYIITLSIYIGASIGLSITDSFLAILFLRALQATGSASTTSLGSGVIRDLIHSSRRGGVMSNYSALGGLGTAFGPVLGGVFAQYTDWHGIFYFLLALSSTMLALITLLVPETLRSIVFDGSRSPPKHLRSPLSWLSPPTNSENPVKLKAVKINILGPLQLMREPEVVCCVVFAGVCYAVWQMAMVATSPIYAHEYGLAEFDIGLTYIGNGIGSLCGSLAIGRILDHIPKTIEGIEKARIVPLFIPTVAFIVCTIAFGWVVQSHVHISVSIILAFFMGGFDTCILAAFSTLIVDLFDTQVSSAIASMNLSRCLLAAAGTSAIQPMIKAFGAGWSFTICGTICILCCPLALLELYHGQVWRSKRMAKAGERVH